MDNTINDPRVVSSYGGGACPEQHWGKLTDGSVFYFRIRHGDIDLHVGPPGTDEADLPLHRTDWDHEMATAARRAGLPYPSFWIGPIGSMEHEDTWGDLRGQFDDAEDRNAYFTRCLDQIWKDGGVDYSER